MIFVNYNRELKEDIKNVQKKYNFWGENSKQFIYNYAISFAVAAGSFLMTSDNLKACVTLAGALAVSNVITVGKGLFNKVKTNIKRKKSLKRLTNLRKKLSKHDVLITKEELESISISKDFVSYNDLKTGEEKAQEVMNYYVRDTRGKIRVLCEMKNELAGIMDSGVIKSTLEITDDKSDIDYNDDFGLYIMDFEEYDNVVVNKTNSLSLKK